MKRLLFLIVLLGIASSATVAATPVQQSNTGKPQRWALLVGVGNQINPKYDLSGPKNDVPAVASVLRRRFGVDADHLRTLRDSEATRANILKGWEWLITSARPGDQVIFYYSGHGTYLPELRPGSEASGFDSALVPYDAVNTATLIRDDEIGERIDRLKTNQVVVIVDACHSGSLARAGGQAVNRTLSPSCFGVKTKSLDFIVPPPIAGQRKNSADSKAPEQTPEIYLGASTDSAKAQEDPFLDAGNDPNANPVMGAFTFYLLEELRHDPAGSLTYTDLIQKVRNDLRQHFGTTLSPSTDSTTQASPVPVQEPQVTGPNIDRSSFLALPDSATTEGNAPTNPSSNARAILAVVASVAGETVALQVEPGASLPLRTILQAESTNAGTQELVQVQSVQGQKATGKLLSGTIKQGDGLFAVARPGASEKLRVSIPGDSSAISALRTTIMPLDFIQIVSGKERADVTLEADTGSTALITPYRGSVPLDPVLSNQVPELLRGLDAAQQLSNLTNKTADLTVNLLANNQEGFLATKIGDRVQYEVRVSKDAYVTIVAVSADGKVTGVSTRRVLAKVPLRFSSTITPPAGMDMIKVFATLAPVNISVPMSQAEAERLGSNPSQVVRALTTQLRTSINKESEWARGQEFSLQDSNTGLVDTNGWSSAEMLIRIH